MKKQLVSLIITTKNEGQVIERLLSSIKKQTYRKIEIIVVDNHSIDKTKNIAKKYTKKVFTAGPERSAQRNYGARKSQGEYLFFLDADMEISPSVVQSCVKNIQKSKKIGMVVVPEVSIAKMFWEKVKTFERSFYQQSGDSQIEAERFFKSEIFNKLGGYDEKITGPEDWDLPEQLKKLGYLSTRIEDLIFHHERINSVWELGRKKYYYGLKSHTYISKNKVSVIGAKTIYFLRPVFYKQWKRLLSNPLMSSAMFFMLTIEQVCGGWGYLYGRYKKI